MNNSLIEKIARGKRALALAREQGKDATEWERRLAELEKERLLGWASELAESNSELDTPIRFIEGLSREVKTTAVAEHARRYLKTIAYASLQQQLGGWSNWTPDWWKEREDDAIEALKSLRSAIGEHSSSTSILED